MKNLKFLFSLFVLFITVHCSYSQNNASVILTGVNDKLHKARDYSVDANIKVDMPFIRMLPVNVKIFYKQKDKFKVVSKGIAIVPRQGFDQLSKIMVDSRSFTSIIQGEELINNVKTVLINIIPLSDTLDLVFGKFWIDREQNIILKSQLTTKSSGTILTEYIYGSQVSYGLPDKLIFTVDVKKFKMPKNISGGAEKSIPEKETKGNGNKQGKIQIILKNYLVNKGIDDSVFKK